MGKSWIEIRAVNQARVTAPIYLHLSGEKRLPQVLGTGRNAVVFLATTTSDPTSTAIDYRAVKFLRNDVDPQYARAAAYRFFNEAQQAQRFHLLQETFVKYYGWGAIGRPESADDKGEYRDFWWHKHLAAHVDALIDNDDANNAELERLRKHYNLQGPFYVLHLCQGTLYDLLDKTTHWFKLPAYSAITTYHDSLYAQSKRVAGGVQAVVDDYLTRPLAGLSGYDILNAFRPTPEANRLRSRAVLQIFSQVVDAVAQLHRRRSGAGARLGEPLAHRDLKPGNIFFQHDASFDGLKNIKVQLSDLGYVTTPRLIKMGDTLGEGKKGVEYQAPGSQYYRAPEQAELPIEVRVDIINAANPRWVRVRGSKVERIEIHDWLGLSDLFSDHQSFQDDSGAGLFKIKTVTYNRNDECYELELDKPIETTRLEDLQGQIIRSTGFQTDGFSLGAILYDMISGGKDPQRFYTYCIVSLLSQAGSVDEIVEVLSPAPTPTGEAEHALNLGERRLMMPAVMDARDLDDLFERLQQIALHPVSFHRRPELRLAERTRLAAEAMRSHDIDELVIDLLRSPLFTNGFAGNGSAPLNEEQSTTLATRLRNFRFRNFEQVNNLLRDRRGVLIPRNILRIIVATMVRDKPGSYYQLDADVGYSSDINLDAAVKIHDDIVGLLSAEEYQLPAKGFPDLLAENLLFKLRSLASVDQPQSDDEPANLP